jgi:hypothetical protein
MKGLRLWVLIVLACLAGGPAYAGTCSNPAGNERDIVYNNDYHTWQFCNGTSWIAFDAAIRFGMSGGGGGGGGTVIFLTSGTSWTVPADWNNSNNTIEVIGGGGGGEVSVANVGTGGGGGGYSKITNLALTGGASVTINIGSGGAGGAGGVGALMAETHGLMALILRPLLLEPRADRRAAQLREGPEEPPQAVLAPSSIPAARAAG